LVGGDAMGLATIAAEVVGAGQVAGGLAGLEAYGVGPHGIGAAVDDDLGVERQQPAAAVGVGGHPVVVLARDRAGDQVLAPVLDVAERPLELEREPGDADFLGLQDAFVAEGAADIGRDPTDTRG